MLNYQRVWPFECNTLGHGLCFDFMIKNGMFWGYPILAILEHTADTEFQIGFSIGKLTRTLKQT